MGRTILTAAERRLAALLFGLSLLGLLIRGGSRLSPNVRAWLADTTVAPAPGVTAPPGSVVPAEGVPPVVGMNQPGARPEEPVNPNTASPALLETLPGVGPVLAARIAEDRMRNGPYRRPEDLLRVKGLGAATLARFRARLALE